MALNPSSITQSSSDHRIPDALPKQDSPTTKLANCANHVPYGLAKESVTSVSTDRITLQNTAETPTNDPDSVSSLKSPTQAAITPKPENLPSSPIDNTKASIQPDGVSKNPPNSETHGAQSSTSNDVPEILPNPPTLPSLSPPSVNFDKTDSTTSAQSLPHKSPSTSSLSSLSSSSPESSHELLKSLGNGTVKDRVINNGLDISLDNNTMYDDLDSEAETERLDAGDLRAMDEWETSRKHALGIPLQIIQEGAISDPPRALSEDISTVKRLPRKRRYSLNVESVKKQKLAEPEPANSLDESHVKKENLIPAAEEEKSTSNDKPEQQPPELPENPESQEEQSEQPPQSQTSQQPRPQPAESASDRAMESDVSAHKEDPPILSEEAIQAAQLAQRKEAISFLTEIEVEFAKLRDRLHADKMARHIAEIEMCAEGTHPELESVYNQIQALRDAKIRLAEQRCKYQRRCIDNQTRACRDQLHQQFLKDQADTRSNLLLKTTEEWYRVNRERRIMDAVVPEFGYRVPTNRQLQREQWTAHNYEISTLAGMSQCIGFPAAPEMQAGTEQEVEEDMQLLGLSRYPHQHNHYHHYSQHQHNHRSH